ncbi:MAG: hypothetical protein AAF456_18425 [Planctomycetota bacterium]
MKNLINTPAITATLNDVNGQSYEIGKPTGSWQLLVFHRQLG